MLLKNFPYFTQLDNANEPYGTCNVTCMAMSLYYHGIRGTGDGQLEDQVYRRFKSTGLDRHDPDHIKLVLQSYPNIKDKLRYNGTPLDIAEALEAHHPVILHGYFTRSGHIITLIGYDDSGYIVNDPYGEIFVNPDGSTYYDTSRSGKQLHYSYNLVKRLASPESIDNPHHYLMHEVSRVL